MASCSSSASSSRSRQWRSTWREDGGRRARAGRPFCATTRPASPRWICSWCRRSASASSMCWSSSAIIDGDAVYGRVVTRRLKSMGIRDRPTAPRSPWQNGYVERLIGSIRRECLYHVVVFGEAHLRRILKAYVSYYNAVRTHLSVNKDAPIHRPIHRLGRIISVPVLGGLHHQYCRT